MDECSRSCFNCGCLMMKPAEFVDDAKCMHPAVKRAMAKKGVKTLDKSKMSKGCPYWTQYADKVEDPMDKAYAKERRHQRQSAKQAQISLF